MSIFQMGHSDDILTAGGRETIRYFLAVDFFTGRGLDVKNELSSGGEFGFISVFCLAFPDENMGMFG